MGVARWVCLRCLGNYEAVIDASGQDNIVQCGEQGRVPVAPYSCVISCAVCGWVWLCGPCGVLRPAHAGLCGMESTSQQQCVLCFAGRCCSAVVGQTRLFAAMSPAVGPACNQRSIVRLSCSSVTCRQGNRAQHVLLVRAQTHAIRSVCLAAPAMPRDVYMCTAVCPRGTYEAASNATDCSRCPINSYCSGGDKVQNPASRGTLVQCGSGLVTRNTGARSAVDCVAPAGFAMASPAGATPCGPSEYAPKFNRLQTCLKCQGGLEEEQPSPFVNGQRTNKRAVCSENLPVSCAAAFQQACQQVWQSAVDRACLQLHHTAASLICAPRRTLTLVTRLHTCALEGMDLIFDSILPQPLRT